VMPSILPLEWTVVAAAFVVFCVVPALIAWTDSRRARRVAAGAADLAASAALAGGAEPLAPVVSVPAPPPLGEALAEPLEVPVSPVPAPPAEAAAAPVMAAVTPPPAPVSPPAAAAVAAVVPVAPETERPVLATPYGFRLGDLRRVRLGDWPPSGVRQDPERRQGWEEGQRRLDADQGRVEALALRAPFPPQACCYAGADIEDGRARIRFLLFPGLWPSAATEAPAAALVTLSGDDVSGTVEAFRMEDL